MADGLDISNLPVGVGTRSVRRASCTGRCGGTLTRSRVSLPCGRRPVHHLFIKCEGFFGTLGASWELWASLGNLLGALGGFSDRQTDRQTSNQKHKRTDRRTDAWNRQDQKQDRQANKQASEQNRQNQQTHKQESHRHRQRHALI